MAYQKVGTPRFYIDEISRLKDLGIVSSEQDTNLELIGLNPEVGKDVQNITGGGEIIYNWESEGVDPKNYWKDYAYRGIDTQAYFAVLNFKSPYGTASVMVSPNNYASTMDNVDNIINSSLESLGGFNSPVENGVSIFTGDISGWYGEFSEPTSENPDGSYSPTYQEIRIESIFEEYVGCYSAGFYYDMPLNPDLDLSMSIEYDGFTNIKTLSGHTITQANYQGSPWWYDKNGNKVEPWSVGQSTGISKRNGRRVWKLKFSYMSDKDLFASNYGSSTYGEQENFTEIGYDGGDVDDKNWTEISLTNGNFETGDLTGWSNNFNASVVSDGSGGYVVRINSAISEISYIAQVVNFENNIEYKFIYEVFSYTEGNIILEGLDVTGADIQLEETVGVHEVIFTAKEKPSLVIRRKSESVATDIKLDNFKLYKSNPSDFQYTIDNDDSFSAQVLNKISHGEKFIFQPDNTSNNPSDFAICVLDGNSFEMKRTAPNVYDIEMTIREVW